ncbi:MAG: D-glycero-alpha-D-manno-heptose-1,7-bisphosphate 7-phosphatase [Gemmatimonadales bacterium]
MPDPAVFLDRDGTIMEDTGFVRDPASVKLIPGAAQAIARLAAAGYRIVVVTNQSGIARGLISIEQYQQVADRFLELLGDAGARVTATYLCPHHPSVDGACECRKPALGNYRLAALEHDLDLTRSVWVGDRMTDLEPARAFEARGILVLTGRGARVDDDLERLGIRVAASLAEAADLILADRE